jgi:hypothetical protein
MTNATEAQNNRSTSSCARKLSVDSTTLSAALALHRNGTNDTVSFEPMTKEQGSSDDVLEKPSLQYRASYSLWASGSENVDNDIDFAAIFESSDLSWTNESVSFANLASSFPRSTISPVVAPVPGSCSKGLYGVHSYDNIESRQSLSHNETSFKDLDVLLGRGGLVNFHPGNQAYLEYKERLQPRYLAASKEEKTAISQELVDTVQKWGGRFMKQSENDSSVWFEVDNLKARKKASQTLREINTPEHRAYKRKQYVENKRAKKARTTD